jgi:Uma2 family endonuclease
MSEKILSQYEKKYTVEDYLKFEQRSANKHEFVDGKVLSTADSNRTHSLIVTNTTIAIGSRVRGQNCEVYAGDMRVQLNPQRFGYPNLVVVNGKPLFSNSQSDILLNPTVIFEVFSKSSYSNDKTEKLDSYLEMESIRECLFVKAEEMRVEHYAKQTIKQWVYRIYNLREDVISLDSINCKISLAEIYSQIKFDTVGKQAVA